MHADAVREQLVADFPREHRWVLKLVGGDGVHHRRGGHLRLGAADDARLEAARFVVSGGEIEFLWHCFDSQSAKCHFT